MKKKLPQTEGVPVEKKTGIAYYMGSTPIETTLANLKKDKKRKK